MDGPSLYDRYTKSPGTSSTTKSPGGAGGGRSATGPISPGQTKSSQLRAQRMRINCYLNAEGVGVTVLGGPQGHGTIVQLPSTCDTLEEVLQHIQLKLKLKDRMMFAADLFLPNGTVITEFQHLVDATSIDTPIIVGCGEPFDGSRVPLDLLAFHESGGGRQAVHKVNHRLSSRRMEDKVDKAESVRQAGHGVVPNSLAVVTARSQNVETNREKAALMREHYMQSLVRRTAEQEDYKFSAQQNIRFHRLEKEESRLRQEDKAMDRMEMLKQERANDVKDFTQAKRQDADRAKMLHDRIKAGKERSKEKKKAHSEHYRKEARKADFGSRPGEEEETVTEVY